MNRKITPLFLLALASLLWTSPLLAQSDASPAEQSLLQLANQARAQHNLPPLRWDANLAQAAQAHLQWVRRNPDNLLHQYPGEPDLLARGAHTGARFATIAENIGARGESPASLQQIWMTTPTHRANLLDPNLNAVGIAVLEANGLLYAVEDFARNVPVQGRDAVEQHVAKLLQDQGIAPAASNEDARKTCDMPQGNAGTPKLAIQWDSADLTQLPDPILQQLAKTKYASAQVGACPGKQPNNQQFTTWHVVVLLY